MIGKANGLAFYAWTARVLCNICWWLAPLAGGGLGPLEPKLV